ncbi:unnamed protein product [Tetraodon nigroviridis]|uniref:Signal transducer and activator of transcription n=1 Tax=Tetraodon nigroviridis TaxID=99883 RepID=Q4RXX3_TETNG|nr:unnamed protein product [Tetraodon nigroviridis]
MAQWDRLCSLSAQYKQQLDELYDKDVLSMEVRHYLAVWIERQEWKRAAQDYNLAMVLYQNLLDNLDIQYSRFVHEVAFLQQHNIRRYKQNFQVCADSLPLFKDASFTRKSGKKNRITACLVMSRLFFLLQCMEHAMCCLEEQQDEFDFKYQTFMMEGPHQQRERMQKGTAGPRTGPSWLHSFTGFPLTLNPPQSVLADIGKHLDKTKEVIDLLVRKELVEWQRRQQKACIGAPVSVCLDQMEKWFTRVAACLIQVREFLGKLDELVGKVTYADDPIKLKKPGLQQKTDKLLHELIKSSFVVETQPTMPQGKGPLVLRTNVQFSVKTRLLVKFPELNNFMKVKVFMDREVPQIKGYRRFNVLGTAVKALNMAESQNGRMVADFRHLVRPEGSRSSTTAACAEASVFLLQTLKEQKSGGGKGGSDISLSVMEELHIICFDTVFQYKDLSIPLQASSLPVVIISNSSQQQSAWASILWFNMISQDTKVWPRWEPLRRVWPLRALKLLLFPPGRHVLRQLSRRHLAAVRRDVELAVSRRRRSGVGGRAAGDDRPQTLRNKTRLQQLQRVLVQIQQGTSMSQGCFIANNVLNPRPLIANVLLQDNPPDTFWVWFDGILVMVKTHLEDLWRNGHIMGFVSKGKEKLLLKKKQSGTFLLRFSESVIGGITFSWVETSPSGEPDVKSVQPFTQVYLKQIPFVEILRSFQILEAGNVPVNPLIYLYPNTPKDEAFGKYYSKESEENSPYIKYIKTKLVFVSKE